MAEIWNSKNLLDKLYHGRLTVTEKRIRIISVVLCEIFAFVTLIPFLVKRETLHLAMCVCTFFLILVPPAGEILLSCKLNPVLFILSALYSIGPMLGDCYRLYYITSWWDKALHIFGGVLFALAGFYIFTKLVKDKASIQSAALFALCFSIAISAVWEFFEFGCDRLLKTDMQRDTVITELHSYELGEALGEEGHIRRIDSIIINGAEMDGYLDTGLIDTMHDMLVETAGALLVFGYCLIDKGKHRLFEPLKIEIHSDGA